MNSSILIDIRTSCNVGPEVDVFDDQLISLINTYLFRSAQFGVGKKGFRISGVFETWEDFIGENADDYSAIKDYIAIRVRLVFDPPDNSALLAALKEEAKELEWCLYDEAEISAMD
jgi:hypothetical protein